MAPAANRINKSHSKSVGALNNGEAPIADDEDDVPEEDPFRSKSNLANSPAVSRKQDEGNQRVGDGRSITLVIRLII